MKKLLFIVGSFRKDSYNMALAKTIYEYLKDKADIKFLSYEDIPYFNEDIEFPAPNKIKGIRNEVKEADGLMFFTPEYNHSYPGALKNLIDWLSRPISEKEGNVLSGKLAAVAGASLGEGGTVSSQDALISLLNFLNIHVMMTPRVMIPKVYQDYKDGKFLQSEKYIFRFADKFLEFIK